MMKKSNFIRTKKSSCVRWLDGMTINVKIYHFMQWRTVLYDENDVENVDNFVTYTLLWYLPMCAYRKNIITFNNYRIFVDFCLSFNGPAC